MDAAAGPPLPAGNYQIAGSTEERRLATDGSAGENASSDVFGAAQSKDVGAPTLAFTNGRGIKQAARQESDQSRDEEILVDVLAESIAAEAAGRAAGLGKTWLASRRAVTDVMALWAE